LHLNCAPGKARPLVTLPSPRAADPIFEQRSEDPDRKHDAERNGDVPTKIERLIQDYAGNAQSNTAASVEQHAQHPSQLDTDQ
jgi:hypothetical protein